MPIGKRLQYYSAEIFKIAYATIRHEITAEEAEEERAEINLRYTKGMPLFKNDGGENGVEKYTRKHDRGAS